MKHRMPFRRAAWIALLVLTMALAAKKKSADDTTQTLELPKDPPMVAAGETSGLTFAVSPLSTKGLLSQQTRDALKAVLKLNGGIPVIHIRAFVAGSGDLRRVPQIVSEVFTEKKLALPSVSVVQVGALPLESAQVVLETVSETKRVVNPDGLTFLEAQSPDALKSQLGSSVPLSVTCFVSDIDRVKAITAQFASAPVDVVQMQRTAVHDEVSCEAVVRGGNVRAAKLAFTGTRVAFGPDEKATRLAFQRMDRDLADGGVQPADIVVTHIYPLTVRMGELARKTRATSNAVMVIPVEGVASIDGSFAVDAIAALK